MRQRGLRLFWDVASPVPGACAAGRIGFRLGRGYNHLTLTPKLTLTLALSGALALSGDCEAEVRPPPAAFTIALAGALAGALASVLCE